EHGHQRRLVGLERAERGRQLAGRRSVDRVAHLRPAEHDRGHRARALHPDRHGSHHGKSQEVELPAVVRIAAAVAPGRSLEQAVERARAAEELGYDSVWLSQLPAERDTSLVLAAYGAATRRGGLRSFLFPIYTP